MLKIRTGDDTVWKVWNWCVDAYQQCGYTLKFPNTADPTKTYQWRYATRLSRKLQEWEFDDQTCAVFIRHAASYAKEQRLLRQGLAALFRSNVLDICFERIRNECDNIDSRLDLLRKSHLFIQSKAHRKSAASILLSRPAPNTYYNIVDWYESNCISKLYLAASRSCAAALVKLAIISPEQRKLLPSSATLFSVLSEFADNAVQRNQAARIMENDWRAL